MASAGRLGRTFLLYAALGLGAGLLLAIALPLAFGARPLVVLSGSMEPTLATGDVVVVKRVGPQDARTGDVVTYRNPEGSLVTHRVRSVRRSGEGFELVTKGDANNASERWTMAADGELSRALYRVPLAGRVLARTSSPQGKLVLIVAPLLLLGAWEIRRIWRPRESPA
jgi:signal peptidase I